MCEDGLPMTRLQYSTCDLYQVPKYVNVKAKFSQLLMILACEKDKEAFGYETDVAQFIYFSCTETVAQPQICLYGFRR